LLVLQRLLFSQLLRTPRILPAQVLLSLLVDRIHSIVDLPLSFAEQLNVGYNTIDKLLACFLMIMKGAA